MTQRRRLSIDAVKWSIDPSEFYRTELPGMSTPRSGPGWTCGGLCPFHNDRRTGNFRVNLDTGAFTCFSCGARGSDVIAFTRLRHGLSLQEATECLADTWGIRHV